MKRVLPLFVIAICFMLTVAGCKKNTPEAAAKTFLTSLYHNDYATAKTVSAKETLNMLNLMEALNSKISDSAKKGLMTVKINITDVKENGDKATVTYTTSENPKEQKLRMIKENGKWLVLWTKQDELDNADDQTPAEQSPSSDTTQVSTSEGATDTLKKK